jgi:hypothetical protein
MRALAIVVLVGVLAGAAAGAAPTVSAKDRADGRAYAAAVARFNAWWSATEGELIQTVRADVAACSEAASPERVDALVETIAWLGIRTRELAPWRRNVLGGWSVRHARYPALVAALSLARKDEKWVVKLSNGAAPDACDVLAEWQAAGWQSSFLDAYAKRWERAAGFDRRASWAVNNQAKALKPKLVRLGLTPGQAKSIADNV